ncbi:unnamed protein product [Schistosoma intercalatum]|nr:unnamed protein product [Schistosoma intercalatum]
MGEFCSKPESGNSQSHPGVPAVGTQHARSRESNVPSASAATAGFLSNMCDTISRLQSENHLPSNAPPPGSRIAPSPEQGYASSIIRNGRSDSFPSGGPVLTTGPHAGLLTPEDMLAAAQICSHLSQSQLNALAAAYHQQQQQIQRSVGPTASGTSTLGHVPGITFAQALAAVTSVSKSSSPTIPLSVHSSQQSPRLPVHSVQTPMHQGNQKRPPSGQSQFHSGHPIQMGSTTSGTRPASASQAVLHHRGSHPGPSGFGTMSSHVSPSQPITSHLDHNLHNAHHQTRASPSLSPSPGSNIYQNRRSQLAPPSTHPNKRPRISLGSQLPHSISSLPSAHVTNTIAPAEMEALLGSVVASKAMASIAAGSNFLNPNAYSAATEVAAAAAAALTPFYTSINNSSLSNPSSVVTPNQAAYQPHIQHHGSFGSNSTSGTHLFNQQHVLPSSSSAYPGSLMGTLPGSLLTSYNNRPFPHATASTQAITSGQALVSAPVLGSQTVTSQPPLSHMPAKASHPTSVSQIPSRLISGHLHHPPAATHPSQGSFHQSNHPLPQPGSQHHVMGHSNLPQGSGVLRQQTKEPAYHPQVEAISPAPDESRLVDAQDAKLHREREEINRQLTVLDADINKQESHLRNLCEREARLTARLAVAPARDTSNNNLNGNDYESKSDKGDLAVPEVSFTCKTGFERNYENPIQAIISDNRQRTRQRHLIFTRLCGPKVRPGPHALPFYRQPSDLSSVRAIQSNFRNHFRPKLVVYLQRRLRAEQSRISFLAQQYGRNSRIFTKKMDKLLSTTKRRQRDLRHRDIFEKAMPEVKKNREDREMGNTEYTKPGIEDDSSGVSNLTDGSQTTPYDAIEEMNKLKEYAIDPPVMLAPWQRRYQFICESGLVTDCRAQLQENQDLSKWSEEEKQIFKERYLATPKNFTSIASYLERKSVADCIHYYYLSKKKEGYKQLLKKHNARRRRAAQTERGGGGSAGGAASNSNAGGSSGSHSNTNINSIPPSSSNCQNGHTNINSPRGERNEADEKDPGGLKNSQTDSSGFPESNETAEHKDADGYRNNKKETHHSGSGGSTGARNRAGRGRPPQHTNHSNIDNHNVGSHGRNRGGNNSTRNNVEPHSVHVPSDVKVPEHDTLVPTIDKESRSGDNVRSDPGVHCAESVTDSNKLAQPRTHPAVVSSSSTRIKDLIHFAIEKNLTKPSSCDNQVTTTETLSSRISSIGPSSSQSTSTNMASVITNSKHNKNPSTSISTVIPSCLVSSHMVTDNSDTSIVFPSTTAAEIYAAAARFAAVSASVCGMNTDPSVMSVSSTVDSSGSHKLDVNKSSVSTASLSSNLHSKSELSDFTSVDAAKKWMSSFVPSCGSLSLSHQTSDSRLMDPSASSKAILIGDFLTAQQLDRADSSNWGGNHSNSRQADYAGSYQVSRSIDPSTLPVCVSHISTAYGNFDCHPVSDFRTSSSVSEKCLGSDILAEHAIRLAIHAKAAAAAAAASSSVNQFDGRGSSVSENNFSGPERCVYSPLSPSPVKADSLLPPANHSTPPCQPNPLSGVPVSRNDTNHQSTSSFTRQLDNSLNSISFKPENDPNMSINSDQVASFIANANKLYLEELGSYTSRDRSNPIRTLTGNESSQFYGVIQQLRQPKEESSSLHLPSACNVSVTNINIPNLNSRDQQSEYMGMCLPRPHSSEGAGNHTFGSYMKSELSRGTPSRCIPSKGQYDRIQTSSNPTELSQFVSDSVNPINNIDSHVSSNTSKRSSVHGGLNTLESHINKAITEEIRAQTISRNSFFPHNICSPHLPRTPSPISKHSSTRNSDSQFHLNVPLKKQDRSISRSPGMVNSSMISGSRDSFKNSTSKIPAPELLAAKLPAANNEDFLNKSNQKGYTQKRKVSEMVKSNSLSSNIDSAVDHSTSPDGGTEFPGLLQIDLAASDFSPKVVSCAMNSHLKDVPHLLSCNTSSNCIQSVKECGRDDSLDRWSHTYGNEKSIDCNHSSTGLLGNYDVDSLDSAPLNSL